MLPPLCCCCLRNTFPVNLVESGVLFYLFCVFCTECETKKLLTVLQRYCTYLDFSFFFVFYCFFFPFLCPFYNIVIDCWINTKCYLLHSLRHIYLCFHFLLLDFLEERRNKIFLVKNANL